MTDSEKIGFHKGSLATLLNERKELMRIVTIVDQLIQAHAKALEELGVKVTQKPKEENMDEKLENILNEQA